MFITFKATVYLYIFLLLFKFTEDVTTNVEAGKFFSVFLLIYFINVFTIIFDVLFTFLPIHKVLLTFPYSNLFMVGRFALFFWNFSYSLSYQPAYASPVAHHFIEL